MPTINDNTYFLNTEVVKAALKNLRETQIHPAFAGYLSIKRAACAKDSAEGFDPKFKSFFDEFLAVGDGSAETPYILPFSLAGAERIWFNSNVAGSYAPSSIRAKSPIAKLCNIETQGRSGVFSLKADYGKMAAELLLKDKKIDPGCLAVFLYRDFSFEFDQEEQANSSMLIEIFRDEFGFRKGLPSEDFQFQDMFEVSENLDASGSVLFVPATEVRIDVK